MGRVKKRYSNYLVHLEKEIFEAADKAGLDRDLAKGLIDEFFLTLQMFISDPRMPRVLIEYFGAFDTPFTALKRLIKLKIKKFRNGTYPKSKVNFGIKRLWAVYKRKQSVRKRNKTPIEEWEYIDPIAFIADAIAGSHSDLPEDYFEMDHNKWFDFIKKEARFGTQMPKNKKLSVLYNCLRGRLIAIDKMEGIEEFFIPERFNVVDTKQGRRSAQEEYLTKIVLAIYMRNFDWDNRKVINEEYSREYTKRTIK
jgi:hypothetical protein